MVSGKYCVPMEGVVETDDAVGFYHKGYLLSSFSPNPFTINGVYYINVEHYIATQKSILAGDAKSHAAIERNPRLSRPLARDIRINAAFWKREFWGVVVKAITAMVSQPSMYPHMQITDGKLIGGKAESLCEEEASSHRKPTSNTLNSNRALHGFWSPVEPSRGI